MPKITKKINPGDVFGDFTVNEYIGKSHGDTYWSCICKCGNISKVRGSPLRLGKSVRCVNCHSRSFVTHGMSRTPTHVCWLNMKRRCCDTRVHNYHRYGGRGIKVCDRWMHSFENFLADMGEKPVGLSIERKNSDENYEPSNCVWATPKQQALNRITNIRATINGETKTISEFSEQLGIDRDLVYARISSGWSHEEALTRKVNE